MKPGVYFIRLGFGDKQPIKIGYSVDPLMRLHSLCNTHKKNGVLLAHAPGPPALEYEIHDRLVEFSLSRELFIFEGPVEELVKKHAVEQVTFWYQSRNPHHSRRKVPPTVMTKERIALVGDYLNGRNGQPKLTGPEVAKKMKISTASVYAFWKQSGHGRFVRKKPNDRAKS